MSFTEGTRAALQLGRSNLTDEQVQMLDRALDALVRAMREPIGTQADVRAAYRARYTRRQKPKAFARNEPVIPQPWEKRREAYLRQTGRKDAA